MENEKVIRVNENLQKDLDSAILLIKNVQENFQHLLDVEVYTENLYFNYKRYKKFLLKAKEILNSNINLFEILAENEVKIEDDLTDTLIDVELSVYDEED